RDRQVVGKLDRSDRCPGSRARRRAGRMQASRQGWATASGAPRDFKCTRWAANIMPRMNDADSPLPSALIDATHAQFIAWLRDVAPYVHAHRGKTFVVAFVGELIEAGLLNSLVHDLSLLHAMGIRLVIVHGTRPQVQAQMH